MIKVKLLLNRLGDWSIYKIRNEWEIYLLIIFIGYWYFLNINGAMEVDETLHAFRGFLYWQGNFSNVTNRPLGLYLIGLGEVLFGRTTLGAKIFPALFGIGAIYLVYIVTKELSHRINGFFAALLTATIPLYALLCVSALLDTIFIFFAMLLLYATIKYSKAENPRKRQFYILSMGVISMLTFTTKTEGICFITVIFFYLIYKEWNNIKDSKILRIRGIINKLRNKKISLVFFLILGVIFGAVMRWQLSMLWNHAGSEGKNQMLKNFGFLKGILLNLDGNFALAFFIIVSVVIFFILWVIYGLFGVELYQTLKTVMRRNKVDKTHQILLYPIGLFSIIIIYFPLLITQPGSFLIHFVVGHSKTLIGGSATKTSVAGSAQGEITPVWAYFYWIYEYLGWIFVIGIILSIVYTIIIIIRRKKIVQKHYLLLFLYFLIPLLLYTLVSKKAVKYLIPLAALFSIYIATHIPKLVQLLLSNPKFKALISKHPQNLPHYISYAVLFLLLIIPGPLQMAINDPDIGFDSGYDDAATIVMTYSDDNANETTYVYAHDKIALEFYMPYPLPGDIVIIPYTEAPSNFSIDALGRPFRYYPDEEIYDMLGNDTIDLAVYPPPSEIASSDRLLERYLYMNNTRVQEINENLAVYYL